MWTLDATVEPTRCYRCARLIDPGTVTFSAMLNRIEYWGDNSIVHYHPACMIDVRAETALAVLSASSAPFADREAILERANARVLNIRAAKAGPKARAKLGAIPAAGFARDGLGRPRVRVLLIGSAAQIDPMIVGDPLAGPRVNPSLAELIHDQTIASPRREYVFVPQGNSPNLRIDPSQPIVGGVLMMHAQSKPAPVYKSRIADWLALSLPAPVIVVIGGTERERDAYASTVREFVERAGARGDECPVVSVERYDRAMWEQIVATLDEHIADTSDAVSGEASVRLAAQLAKAVDEGVLERTELALKRAIKVIKSARVAERKQMAAAATRCLSTEALRRLAIDLLALANVEQDGAAIVLVLDAMRAAATRTLNADFARLATIAREDNRSHEALDALLLGAVTSERPGSQRFTVCLTALRESTRQSTATQLRARMETHPKAASALDETAAAIERRNAAKPSKTRPRVR